MSSFKPQSRLSRFPDLEASRLSTRSIHLDITQLTSLVEPSLMYASEPFILYAFEFLVNR
eukprot:1390933-Amorphochlora_amoeboformis.AAC.1